MNPKHPSGAGLGFRRELIGELKRGVPDNIAFFELAPENWAGMGGQSARDLRHFTERYPFVCHGLSLSLGGPAPLDETLLVKIRRLMDSHGIALYSEHLSFCSDDGQLYDLLPVPFTDEAVRWIAARIRRAQDILGRRMAVENVSYYLAAGQELSEIDFVRAVLQEADCDLLLDVNNIYVNSVNHGYDAEAFLAAMPGERIAYYHVAGHFNEAPDLIVDTHGAPVIDPVWDLLGKAYARFGVRPTLLERDTNIPPLAELLGELAQIRSLQRDHAAAPSRHAHAV